MLGPNRFELLVGQGERLVGVERLRSISLPDAINDLEAKVPLQSSLDHFVVVLAATRCRDLCLTEEAFVEVDGCLLPADEAILTEKWIKGKGRPGTLVI